MIMKFRFPIGALTWVPVLVAVTVCWSQWTVCAQEHAQGQNVKDATTDRVDHQEQASHRNVGDQSLLLTSNDWRPLLFDQQADKG